MLHVVAYVVAKVSMLIGHQTKHEYCNVKEDLHCSLVWKLYCKNINIYRITYSDVAFLILLTLVLVGNMMKELLLLKYSTTLIRAMQCWWHWFQADNAKFIHEGNVECVCVCFVVVCKRVVCVCCVSVRFASMCVCVLWVECVLLCVFVCAYFFVCPIIP